MNVTELTKEIYEKYPNVYIEINQYICDYIIRSCKCINILRTKITEIPLPMLYGLLEDFFEENGIIINVSWCLSSQGIKSGKYELYDSKLQMLYNKTFVGASKDFAKYESILKACKIQEDKP